MPRESFVIRDGQCIPKHLAGPLAPRGPASGLARPMVIGDTCEFRSTIDGSMITSKAKWRADLRARGLTEVGNEPLTRQATKEVRSEGIVEDVKRAIAQAAA